VAGRLEESHHLPGCVYARREVESVPDTAQNVFVTSERRCRAAIEPDVGSIGSMAGQGILWHVI